MLFSLLKEITIVNIKLTSDQIIEKQLFKQQVYSRLHGEKVKNLTTQILSFLRNGHDFSTAFEKIGAFNFEFDSYLSFHYVGYPNYLFEFDWKKNIVIDVSCSSDIEIRSELKDSFMNNSDIPIEIREQIFYDIARECDCLVFCEAWKNAIKIDRVNKLCFVEVHDCGAGYDCETSVRLSEEEIEQRIENWNLEKNH